MTLVDTEWDGSAANYPTAKAYCDACLYNGNTGDSANWTKDACKLPVADKDGNVNKTALGTAAAALNGGRNAPDMSPTDIKVAKKKLANLTTR